MTPRKGARPVKAAPAADSNPLRAPPDDNNDDDRDYSDDVGLLSKKRIRFAKDTSDVPRYNWLRPYWLGVGLFLVLFPFWLLDSLKDPILGSLTDNNLERHQPPAKLFSVCTTLGLVCFLEYFSNEKKRQHRIEKSRTEQEILDGGGPWEAMRMRDANNKHDDEISDDAVPSSIFAIIGLPYCLAFGFMAYLLQFNANVALTDGPTVTFGTNPQRLWGTLGYFFFAAIESYGSLSVAAFWSYTNSTLSLDDAESFYGPIIAIAQLGAACGSTMVTTQVWNNVTLIVLACLIILLHILVMTAYSRRFPPSNHQIQEPTEPTTPTEPTVWSGVYLILKHNYVLLIFGASSLYEISLTVLNYQMTLLGWRRFEETEHENMSVRTIALIFVVNKLRRLDFQAFVRDLS